VRAIRKRLEKRIVETLAQMLEAEREEYQKFWADFGTLIKEGIYAGDDEDKRLSKLLLFETTHSAVDALHEAGPTTLAEYVSRCPKEQTAIWYLAGSDRKALEGSPHVELFKKRGIEVLFFTDPIDEWLLQRLSEFEGKPLKPIDRGALEIEGESEKEAREKFDRDNRDLLGAIESQLSNDVKSVRFTTRLSDSPAVLVNDEHAISANMERILRAANQEVKREKRILELNPDHPWTQRLKDLYGANPRSDRLQEMIELLHGQALLAEGSALPDAARFAKLVSKFVVEM